MSFYSQYELLEPLPGKTVKSFKARDLTSGRFVMVHLLVGEAAALESHLETLPQDKRAQIVDRGSNEGTPYVVTAPLPAGVSFEEWVSPPAPAKDIGSRSG